MFNTEDKLIYRKFLSLGDDSSISVRGNLEKFISGDDDDVECLYASVDLSFSDGGSHFSHYTHFSEKDDDLDEQVADAIKQLEILRSGICAAMDEIGDNYAEMLERRDAKVS